MKKCELCNERKESTRYIPVGKYEDFYVCDNCRKKSDELDYEVDGVEDL